MISSRLRVLAVFFLFCAFALITISSPIPKDVALSKRSNGDDVLAILKTIKADTDNILPQIDALVAGGLTSDTTVRPLLSHLALTASNAIKSVSSLQHPITFTSGTTSQADIVSLAVVIVSNLAKTAVGLVLSLPNLLSTAVFVVTSLLQNLTGLSIILPGLPPIILRDL